jgi:hypothetical protein
MSGFLVDTNISSELVRPQPEPKVRTWVAAQRGFAASCQRSAFSDQLAICDKFAGGASWMSFSEPEVPEVQGLSADG